MGISIDRAFGLHDDALVLRARRAEVLAQNLVHADTPGYRARDVDFSAALARAAGARGGPLAPARTHAAHLAPAHGAGARGLGRLAYRVPAQPSLDGNTVDAQVEKAAYMDNALRYQATLTILNGRIRGLRTAIGSGQ